MTNHPNATHIDAGSATQAWLATSNDPAALRSGAMYDHGRAVLQPGPGARALHPAVNDVAFQDAMLDELARLTGITLPVGAAIQETQPTGT